MSNAIPIDSLSISNPSSLSRALSLSYTHAYTQIHAHTCQFISFIFASLPLAFPSSSPSQEPGQLTPLERHCKPLLNRGPFLFLRALSSVSLGDQHHHGKLSLWNTCFQRGQKLNRGGASRLVASGSTEDLSDKEPGCAHAAGRFDKSC